jgi:hypothetical protein
MCDAFVWLEALAKMMLIVRVERGCLPACRIPLADDDSSCVRADVSTKRHEKRRQLKLRRS